MEILKQGQYGPLDVADQVMIIYAASNDMLDDLDVSVIKDFETQFYKYMDDHYPEIKREIHETGNFSAETEELMKKGIEEFKKKGFING
jgi:F-type H+-transporting ATPase subunit alpha